MTITPGGTLQTELDRVAGWQGVFLLDLDFSTGNRRFALWPHDVVYASNTYVGLGPIQQLEGLEQDQQGSLSEVSLAFFAQNDPSLLEDLQQKSRRRIADCYLVFLHPTTMAVAGNEAIHLWHRRMVPGIGISSEGTYASAITLESVFHQHRNRAPRTYSNAEQLRTDPTDFSFFNAGKNLDLTRTKYKRKSGLTD